MTQQNYIITFANQKGGVGKSTLCTLFANYLSVCGIPVKVIDCDRQNSIGNLRKKELQSILQHHKNADTFNNCPFEVILHPINDKAATERLIGELIGFDGVVLVDSPGNLHEEGLVSLYANSDRIICPFFLDKVTIFSTSAFVVIANKLFLTMGESTSDRLIFVPNRIDGRIGTADEKAIYSSTKLKLGEFGAVAPEVASRACLQRYSTMTISDEQMAVVKNTFDFILETIGITSDKTSDTSAS